MTKRLSLALKLTVNLLTPAHHAVDVVAVAETALVETVVVVDAVVAVETTQTAHQ